MNYSAWNSLKSKKRNPALSPGHVIVEFDRTKKQRIFAHKLGGVNFSSGRNVNSERQEVIDREIGNITINGFKYKNVGHVYSADQVIPRVGDTYSYPVYAHGHPMGGTEHAGMENCARSGLQCKSGEGTNSLCNPGKCVIGTLERVTENKWKYTSVNTYGSPARPVIYYLPADKSVKLKTILRGYYVTYAANGSPYRIAVTKPASATSTILLPPKFYYSDDFIDSAIIRTDERLQSVARRPTVDIIGVENRKARFVSNIIISAYPGTSEGYLNDRLHVTATEEIVNALVEAFSGLDKEWTERCNSIINEEFSYRFSKVYDGLDLISVVFDRVKALFESIVQITGSSLLAPQIYFEKEKISRPVYSRLPGLMEAYRSETETPSQWLTSGTDEFLSKKKDSIATFYSDFLNPDTCNPALLDWLAQHAGLFGALWNPLWDNKIKRTLIKNAFGWWDRQSSVNIPALGDVPTAKGLALEEFPFTQPEWSTDPLTTEWGSNPFSWNNLTSWSGNSDNLLGVKLDEIETIRVVGGTLNSQEYVKIKSFSDTTDRVSVFATDTVRVDKNLWNGLIEAKGSLLGVAFLSSAFGLKAHTSAELEIVDASRKILRPRSGLRNAEITAPILLPYKSDAIQVGTIADASMGNYTNQLVAGVSRVSTPEGSNNAYFRVPYYYNRDGKSWDRVSYIASNWMPSNLNVRVQYAYLSADLWAVGDAFFEPEVIVT